MEEAVTEATLHSQILQSSGKEAFMEALIKCKDTIDHESPEAWFHEREPLDKTAAAYRLSNYWQERKRLFGERAYLPMRQDGQGALNAEDIALLRTGYFSVFPITPLQGTRLSSRTIYFADSSEIDAWKEERESCLRCLFYLLQVCSEQIEARTEGITAIVQIDEEAVTSSSFEVQLSSLPHLYRLCHEILPCRLHTIHIAVLVNDNHEQIRAIISAGVTAALKDVPFQLHVQRTRNAMAISLELFGIQREALPTALGGTITMEKLDQWHELRLQLEGPPESKQRATSGHSGDTTPPSGAVVTSSTGSGTGREENVSSATTTEAANTEAAKSANTEAVKSAKAKSGKSSNDTDKRPSKSSGKSNDEQFDEEEKTRLQREKTAMYSRRKYERKKIEIQVLKEQEAASIELNRRLKLENNRLEALRREADRVLAEYSQIPGLVAPLPPPQMQPNLLQQQPNLLQQQPNLFQQLQQQQQQPQLQVPMPPIPPMQQLPPQADLGMLLQQLLQLLSQLQQQQQLQPNAVPHSPQPTQELDQNQLMLQLFNILSNSTQQQQQQQQQPQSQHPPLDPNLLMQLLQTLAEEQRERDNS